jgi:hypothetical protein
VATYLWLMLDAAGTIREICTMHCADDAAALAMAQSALVQFDRYDAAEVWRSSQRIGKVRRPNS